MTFVLAALLLLLVPTALCQTRLFDLDKLDSESFRKFIAEKKVIVVGEMHGTTEVPLFVLDLTRLLTDNGNALTVGLEIPINNQKDIDNYLRTGDFDKLLELPYFKDADGRTSVAMGQLIKGLRDIEKLRVVCFDIDTQFGPGVNRDSLMGLNLSKVYKGGQMVILTGNLHANLKEGYWRPNFKSATFHFDKINKFGDKLVALNTYFGSGTIWNCMQDGCRERDAGSDSILKQKYGLLNFIGIYDVAHPSGYGGFIYIDKVTASKPLVN